MKFIRPYGKSKTKTSVYADQGDLTRYIYVKNRDEALSFDVFQKESGQMIISFWISTLDKIIKKPKKRESAPKNLRNLRDKIGKAMWPLMVELHPNLDEKQWEDRWNERLHPYEVDDEKTENLDKMKGRFYPRFCNDIEPRAINAKRLAKEIEDHLYEAEKTKHGKKQKGLIPLSVKAVQKSVFPRERPQFAGPDKYDELCQEIYEACAQKHDSLKKQSKNLRAKTAYHIAARHLYKHFAELFPNAQSISKAKGTNKDLFDNHMRVKEVYRRLLKRSKKTGDNLLKQLPKNQDELTKLLNSLSRNKERAYDIRLGKIIHYHQMKHCAADPYNFSEDIDIANSEFWCSDGQITIKQNEAFQRVWRNALAFMAHGMTLLVDPHNKVGKDILVGPGRDCACEKFDADAVGAQISNLFSQETREIIGKEREKDFVFFLLKKLTDLRNKTLHFTDISNFQKAIEGLNFKEGCSFEAKFKKIWNMHEKMRNDRVFDELKAVGALAVYDHQNLKEFVKLVINSSVGVMPLPRFNRLMNRKKNIGCGFHFKDDINQENLKENPDLRRHYVLFQKLYNTAFRADISKGEGDIRPAIEAAIKRSDKGAYDINKAEAKVKKIFNSVSPPNNIAALFDELTSEMTTESRLASDYYGQEREKATKQSAYIEDIKLDVIGILFDKWVKKKNLSWIYNNAKKEAALDPQKEDDFHHWFQEQDFGEKICEQYQSIFYMLCFLMPVSVANNLSGQLRKWITAKRAANQNNEKDHLELAEKLLDVLSLYMASHDAVYQPKADNEAQRFDLSNEDIDFLFETTDDYDAFSQLFYPDGHEVGSGEQQGPNLRGWREMRRFGGLQYLKPIFEKHQITTAQIEEFENMRDYAANWHKKRADLHKKLVKIKSQMDKQNPSCDVKEYVKEYRKVLKRLSRYNHLKHHLFLTNHVTLHRLLLRSLGRLVDYAGLFERDLYFQLLDYAHRNNLKFNNGEKNLLKKGRIIKCLRQLNKQDNKVADIFPDIAKDNSKNKTRVNIRNNFAHFNMLREGKEKVGNSLISYVNDARHLMSYDRKLKNAVSKSIIDLFQSENFELNVKLKDGKLSVVEIKPRTIFHLNNFGLTRENKIKEELQGEFLIKIVEDLLDASKK